MRLVRRRDMTTLLLFLVLTGATSTTFARTARYIPPKYEDYIDVDALDSSSTTVASVSRPPPASSNVSSPVPNTPRPTRPSSRPVPVVSMPNLVPPPMPIQQPIFPSGLFNPLQKPSPFPPVVEEVHTESNFPDYGDYAASAQPCGTRPCATGIDSSIMSQTNFERPNMQIGGQHHVPHQHCGGQGNCNANLQVQPPNAVSILSSFFPHIFSEE